MRYIVIAALAIGMAACTNNDTTAPSVSLSGNYTLRTVNGSPLPFTFSDGNTVTSDVLTIRDDGTFSDAVQFAGGSVQVFQGFYTSNNGAISFTDQDSGSNSSGSISGSVLTEVFANNGPIEVFQKT